MWTHRTPYVPSDLTEESIERHGRIALNRALHLDRVIAFVGSGVSAAYGGPAWSDFAVFMVAAVRDAIENRDFPAGLSAVHEHLAKIVGGDLQVPLGTKPGFVKEIGDHLTTLLALCEDALRLVDAYPAGDAGATRPDGERIGGARKATPLLIEELEKRTATARRRADLQSGTHRKSARGRLAAEIVANGAQDAARRLADLLKCCEHDGDIASSWKNLKAAVDQLGATMEALGTIEDQNERDKAIETIEATENESACNSAIERIKAERIETAASARPRAAGAAPVFIDLLKLYAALLTDRTHAAPLVKALVPKLWRRGGAAEGADVIAGILDLGIGRFATLNYDVTLERRIHALKEDIGEPVAEAFRDLLWPRTDPAPKSAPLDISSGDEGPRTVRSTILTASTAGELFNFALRDSVAGSHVVHIHGRYDHPDDILLTEEDYRRQYIASGEYAGALGETMRVMFSGNDVLFIGVGLKEDDVLGPLRSVLTRDRSPDADARQTIALMPATVPKLHADEENNKTSVADSARRDALFAVHQKLKYGINVLRYGRDDRAYQRFTGLILALQDAYEKTSSQPASKSWYTSRFDEAFALFGNGSGAYDRTTRVLPDEETTLRTLCENLDEFRSDMRRHAAIEILKILRGRVQARALVAELELHPIM